MDPSLLAAFLIIPCLLLFMPISISLFTNLCLIEGGFTWRNYQRQQNPNKRNPIKNPNKFSWPLLGFLRGMGPLAHRKLATAAASSIGATRLMGVNPWCARGAAAVVVSSHPETAREILCGNAFGDRPVGESARLLMFDRAIGFSPSGEYWRHLRRIASAHMFSPKRISALQGHRQAAADEMVERVRKEMSERGVVEVREVLQKGCLESVLESVFGSVGGVRGDELGLMVKEGYELMGESNWGDYFGIGFLDFGGVKRRCHKLATRVREVVSEIIKERRERGDFIATDDFLSVLLALPKEDRLTDLDMVAVLWEMVFRGIDNIAILLEWTMARMTLHQDVQASVRKEIHTNVARNQPVQDSDVPNLPYLQAVVKEVLRLHPPGPLLSWARLAIHDVHVDNHLIPAGTTAMVNMWAIAHDPAFWPDPWSFKPERFLEHEFSVAGSDLRLAPFGSGRRACPGRALGLAAVHVWLARFLQQFMWIPAAPPVDLGECLKLSLEMKKPLRCRVIDVSKTSYPINKYQVGIKKQG